MPSEATIDSISHVDGSVRASGDFALMLLNNDMNVNALRTNDVLRKDEWIHYDTAVIDAAQERLIGVGDLMSRGLTISINNGMGKTVLEYEDVSDTEDAELTMDAVTRGNNDRLEFNIRSLPLPIIHKDFQINARVLSASRTLGQSLDVSMAELSARKVSERVEEILFNGASAFTFGGGTLRGYTDEPNRNTVTLVTVWDDAAKTGEDILQDVRDMKQAAIDDLHFGPYMLYIPTNYETVLDDDFKADSDKTIRQRITEIANIIDVKVADKLTDDNVVLVQMTSDVTRIVEGMPITTVEWQTEGNMRFHFKVMTIMVPQVRSDQEGRSGVVHLS